MEKLLLIQFDLHHILYNNVLQGFTDTESNQRLHGDKKMNHVKYLAGHLLNSQYGLAMIAGLSPKVKWNSFFAVANQSEAKDDVAYPSLEEIKAEWNTMHQKIRAGLDKLSEKDMGNKPPKPMANLFPSVGEFWAFINHHQAYHIGQIGILRRGFGKEAMRYD